MTKTHVGRKSKLNPFEWKADRMFHFKNIFTEKIVVEKNENKQKEVGIGPFSTN